MKLKYDITAIGNALVDTQFKVSHEFISEVGLVMLPGFAAE